MRKWEFPSVNNIGIKGFNDIGEEFKDNPMFHLAKEICQNSLDTKVSSAYIANKNPIKIEFKEYWMKASEIPGNANGEFRKIFEEELKFNDDYYKNDRTVPEFYETALKILDNDSIRCLRISDYNTPGLTGSDKKSHSPWSDLTKNAGVSDKNEGSAGSKGKGKFASFICSNFYTVFYSTMANDGLCASCGISRLTGYEKSDGTTTIGEGYYEDNYKTITECLNLDSSFVRNEYGTDIYIIGFKNNYDNWKERIVASVIDNFLVAINRGDLVVVVGEEYEISKSTLNDLINREIIMDNLSQDTKCYYEILIADEDEVMIEKHSMFEENDMILYLKKDLEDIGEANKVAVVRLTGMKILDMKGLPKLGIYHGILFMNGLRVNDYFRKLENATHSNWSADRVQNTTEASQKISEVRTFVRETIKKLMTGTVLEEVSATGVGETLPDEEEYTDNIDNDADKNESIENENIKTFQIIEKIPKKQQSDEKNENDEEPSELELELDENGEIIDKTPVNEEQNSSVVGLYTPHPNPIDPEEYNYSEVKKKIIPRKLRLIENNQNYKLIFGLNSDEDIIKISLDITGESGKEKVVISKAKCKNESKFIGSNINVEIASNNLILKNLKKENLYSLDIQIKSDDKWVLEVNVYGINK